MWQARFPAPAHLPKNTCNQCKNPPLTIPAGHLLPFFEIKRNLCLSDLFPLPHSPRSAIELAVQLFCIPVDGTKSAGSESKMREDRTVCRTCDQNRELMSRMALWHNDDSDGDVHHGLLFASIFVVRRLPLDRSTFDVPVVSPLGVLENIGVFNLYIYELYFDVPRTPQALSE